MNQFLITVPWILAVGALLFILVRKNSDNMPEDEEYEDALPDIVRVAVFDDKAYWVYNNIFYEAETFREPDFSTAKPIDAMSMSEKKLNELLIILDELKETER